MTNPDSGNTHPYLPNIINQAGNTVYEIDHIFTMAHATRFYTGKRVYRENVADDHFSGSDIARNVV
jgi:hypothetical protein